MNVQIEAVVRKNWIQKIDEVKEVNSIDEVPELKQVSKRVNFQDFVQ
jgi:hypothetical protein